MPNWKRVIVSGSSAHLNHVTASGHISGSSTSTGSFGSVHTAGNVYLGDGTSDSKLIRIEAAGGEDASIRLMEGETDTYGFSLFMDGGGNQFSIRGHDASAGGTAHLTMERDTGAATFAGDVDITRASNAVMTIKATASGTGARLKLKSANNDATYIAYYDNDDTTLAQIYSYGSSYGTTALRKSLEFKTGGSTTALTLDGSQNATFGGNVSGSSTSTGSFGSLYAGGTGDSIIESTNALLWLRSITAANANYSATVRFTESPLFYLGGYITYDGTSNNMFKLGTHSESDQETGNDVDHIFLPRDNSGDVIFPTANAKISGSSSSTGSFGHLVIAKDAHIGEDVLADGDVVAYNSSDVRLKDNLQVIKGSLDKIGKINGYEFDWNDKSPGWARERGHDVGVIAQEVQKVLPEVVVERKSGYLGVDYKRLIPLLVESIKELKQEVENLKKKVN